MKKKIKFNNKNTLLASIILVFFIIIFGIYFYYLNLLDKKIKSNLESKPTKKEEQVVKCEIRRKLDGMCTENGQENLWPVAIIIDNHPDSWPQHGLSKAQLVYNTLVEGDATRMMAAFSSDEEIEKIGPVRSARPYYLTWAKGLSALFGHSGGSPEALEKIKEYKIIDWEEATTYGPLYFERDHTKLSPHNLFTSNEKINAARIDWELFDKVPTYQVWQFNTTTSTQISPEISPEMIDNIYINYSPGVLFDVEYKYNTSSEVYLRFQNNKPQIDDLTNEQITVKNLIIQFVPEEIHLDKEDRLQIKTIGQGKAWIFYGGKMIKGIWVKNSLEERTMFYNNEDGKEIIFLPGNIWIEVVPGAREVMIE